MRDIETKLFCQESQDLRFTATELHEACTPSFLQIQRRLMPADEEDAPSLPRISIQELFQRFHHQKQLLRNANFALTDVFYAAPLSRAIALDAKILTRDPTDNFVKHHPLLGCILSIKDSVMYRGSSSTHGFKVGYNKPFEKTAGIIAHLENLGAIVVCKGNVPQALMTCESNNFLFGNTSHPLDPSRTAGGSSGGEAANLATFVVNGAVGSDIAGSLRIPALFCGVFALKPTAGRFSICESAMSEKWPNFGRTGDCQLLILPTCGPMARSALDIEALSMAMNNFSAYTLDVPPLPWTPATAPKKIGVLKAYSSIMEVCTATQRALNEAVAASGLETVEIDIDDLMDELVTCTLACFMKDEELRRFISRQLPLGEPLIDAYDSFRTLLSIPVWLLRLVVRFSLASPRDEIYIRGYLKSIDFNWEYLSSCKWRLRLEVIRRFHSAGVRVCLAHGIFPAIKKNTAKHCDLFAMYCFIWNFLNFPVGAVPITTVKECEQTYESVFNDKCTATLRDALKGAHGLPVGIQVVGLPWTDESVVEVMKLLESGLVQLAGSSSK